MNLPVMIKRTFPVLGVLALIVALPALSRADTVIGQETNAGGFVGDVLANFPGALIAASDGEAGFFPFGSTFDTSDALQFGPGTAGFFHLAPGSGAWKVSATDPNTYFLPAINENEPGAESVGKWLTEPGITWVDAALGTYIILSEDGAVSDTITLANINGTATVTFASDPAAVPEPASVTLLAIGIAGLAVRRLRRKSA